MEESENSSSDWKTRNKERAKKLRREAYLKAKNSPAALERKAKMKEMRRAYNEKLKSARKLRANSEKQEASKFQHFEQKSTASEAKVSGPPKLRLIKGGIPENPNGDVG